MELCALNQHSKCTTIDVQSKYVTYDTLIIAIIFTFSINAEMVLFLLRKERKGKHPIPGDD